VQSNLARFTKKVVALDQKAVVGNPRPAVQQDFGGYADWVIVSIHGLKTYLDLPYRRLLDVLHEMPRISRILGLEATKMSDFTTVCARMQGLKMPLWCDFLRLSVKLLDTGEIHQRSHILHHLIGLALDTKLPLLGGVRGYRNCGRLEVTCVNDPGHPRARRRRLGTLDFAFR